MRIYRDGGSNEVIEVKCNMCGKNIKIENGYIAEGNMSIDYLWGYFSDKDAETHSFDICEKCYDRLAETFVIPVDVKETTELL